VIKPYVPPPRVPEQPPWKAPLWKRVLGHILIVLFLLAMAWGALHAKYDPNDDCIDYQHYVTC
jgi:hypothetical protein